MLPQHGLISEWSVTVIELGASVGPTTALTGGLRYCCMYSHQTNHINPIIAGQHSPRGGKSQTEAYMDPICLRNHSICYFGWKALDPCFDFSLGRPLYSKSHCAN